jgi:uncharacterized protein (DUF1330 family)
MIQRILIASLLLIAAPLAFAADAQARETRFFEMRTYYAAPGKLDDLLARFRNHTLKLFEKHGMTNIGYFVPVDNADNKLIYFLAFPDRDARNKAFKEFSADPDWKAAAKASEANGKLVTKVESVFLTATDFSPQVNPVAAAEPRAFELRIYKAAEGRLPDLLARFRDHTLKLFDKHGMTSIAYFTPVDPKQGAADTLVYILAHKSQDAAAESWKNFRDDPDWIAAKKASEDKAGGSLTLPDGVKSTFMKPTDYSPIK